MPIYLFILELHSAYQEVFIQLLEYLILMLVGFPSLWTFESVFSYLVQSILLVTLMFTDCSNKQAAAMKEYLSLLLPCSHGHDLSSHNVPTFTISSRIYSENGFQIYRKEREMDAMNFRDAAARSRAVKLVLMSHILQNCFHEQQNWAQITFISGTLRSSSAPRRGGATCSSLGPRPRFMRGEDLLCWHFVSTVGTITIRRMRWHFSENIIALCFLHCFY